jgi:poly(3-hydroxybutyrate) depolymerase
VITGLRHMIEEFLIVFDMPVQGRALDAQPLGNGARTDAIEAFIFEQREGALHNRRNTEPLPCFDHITNQTPYGFSRQASSDIRIDAPSQPSGDTMIERMTQIAIAVVSAALMATAASAAEEYVRVPAAACHSPPELTCPERGECPPELIAHLGNATDPGTGRNFFLDYPCDLQPGEPVTLILNLHGGGSIGNWQRHYFPAMDLKEDYRLVIASPSGVVRAWMPDNDDEHLRNIIELVYEQFGADNIAAFWLIGHSQGGQTSNRLINDDPLIRERLTGWVSLSGGRLGSLRSEVRAPIPQAPAPPAAASGSTPAAGGGMRLVADASVMPDFAFSHIYSSGEHELTSAGLPPDSKWAEQLGCGPQTRVADVVDTKGGYVYDSREQPNRNKVWGLDPGPGTAEVYVYPDCEGGHVVADVIRLDKGHTEGLEPNVTEAIVRLMLSAGDPRQGESR